jgi:beta propeller repeat protein
MRARRDVIGIVGLLAQACTTEPATTTVQGLAGTTQVISLGDSTRVPACGRISGNVIVWSDRRLPDGQGEIYMYDLATAQTIDLSNTSDGNEVDVDVSGSQIVWSFDNAVFDGLMQYDLATQQTNLLGEDAYAEVLQTPALSGDNLTWGRFIYNGVPQGGIPYMLPEWDIGYGNLATGGGYAVTYFDERVDAFPRISDRWIAWDSTPDAVNDDWGISAAMIAMEFGQVPNQIITTSTHNGSFDLDGATLEYAVTDPATTATTIIEYNLDAGTSSTLTSSTGGIGGIAISGNRVVYSDLRSGDADVYLFDRNTRQESLVVAGANWQVVCDIDANRVLYYDQNGPGLYLFTIDTTPDDITTVTDTLDGLVTSGVLRPGQENSFIAKLNAVRAAIAAGDTATACADLAAFINEVNAYVRGHKLTQAQGQQLIAEAQKIERDLGC